MTLVSYKNQCISPNFTAFCMHLVQKWLIKLWWFVDIMVILPLFEYSFSYNFYRSAEKVLKFKFKIDPKNMFFAKCIAHNHSKLNMDSAKCVRIRPPSDPNSMISNWSLSWKLNEILRIFKNLKKLKFRSILKWGFNLKLTSCGFVVWTISNILVHS